MRIHMIHRWAGCPAWHAPDACDRLWHPEFLESARIATDMRRTSGYLSMRFEPCVLPKMSISSSVHMSSVNMFVYNVHVSSSDSVQLLLRT